MTRISEKIISSAIKIHKTLGPGLLENVYQGCLIYELQKQNVAVQREVTLPVKYEEMIFETGYRADLIVDQKVLIEIKSIEKTLPIHKAQTLTYLKLTNYPLALLINFGEALVKDRIHRFANGEAANDL
jgi:GxxExxY protein